MAGGVAEVEHATNAAFPFVRCDHLGLDATAFGDDGCHHLRRATEGLRHVTADPVEEIPARRHPVLDDFVEAGAKLAPRQRLEHERIDGHEPWLMEGADQVLPEWMVHAHLAA